MLETAAQASPLLFDDLPIQDLGTISIRVFVLPPKPKKGNEKQTALPLDVEEGEEFMLDLRGNRLSVVTLNRRAANGVWCIWSTDSAKRLMTTRSSCRSLASGISVLA